MNTDNSYYNLSRPEIARLIVNQPSRILEIGCANGNFKRNFTWPCEYHGVEPFAEAANKAKQSGIKVYEGFYDSVSSQIPNGHFDLIVCNDVIEHMSSPWEFLENIKSKLAPGGKIIGSMPNVRYLQNLFNLIVKRDWCYTSAGVLDRTHLRFFTVKSLRRLFSECGYKIEFLHPSGPDRYKVLKNILKPFVFPIGTDSLYMQIAFRIAP